MALKFSGFIKNCYSDSEHRRRHDFIEGLVSADEDGGAGMKFYFDDEYNGPLNTNRPLFDTTGIMKSLLLVSEEEDFLGNYVDVIESSGVFANQVTTLCNTKDEDVFARVSRESLANGMFLSLDEQRSKEAKKHVWPLLNYALFAAVITLELPKDEVDIDREGDTPTIVLTALQGDEDTPMIAFSQNAKYRGYVTNETETSVTCIVPMCIAIDEDEYYDLSYEIGQNGEWLYLTCLWSKCQENLSVPEGIALADGLVAEPLHQKLMLQIDALADNTNTEADYHPHSNGIVRDLVHPALYSYVKGVSSTHNLEAVPPATFSQSVEWNGEYSLPDDPKEGFDYWGREYEASAKYQWLPTYFDIAADGSCSIADYINNLVPRGDYEPLYESLSQLFSQALPLIESVFSYGRSVRPRIRFDTAEEELDFDDTPPSPLKEVYHSLRGERLQVITKIVDYELKPGQTYEGVWHVEGMSHEEIVATAIYFIHRDDDIKGGDILFKRAFHMDEAQFIFSNVNQSRPAPLDQMIEDGLSPLGTAKTLSKRLLVFPNSHVHKVSKLENTNVPSVDTNETDSVQKRRIIVFFLINPEKRIVSTREVPPQQKEFGGSMSREDAMEHRLKLMKERKYTKQDWNVREIELCEH
eukprot:404076_1